MSDYNEIDDLFKAKLSGREVGYSASAWSGADAMLGKHFHALLIKKILWVTIPVILASGAGLAFWLAPDATVPSTTNAVVEVEPTTPSPEPTQVATESSMEIAVEESEFSSNPNGVSSNPTIVSAEESEASTQEIDPVTQAIAIEEETASNEVQSAELDLALTEDATASVDKTPSIALPPGFDEFLETAFEPMTSTQALNKTSTDEAEVFDEIELDDQMAFMPTFKISMLSKSEICLADNRQKLGEGIMAPIRKLEFSAKAGLLAASPMSNTNPSVSGVGTGFYAGLSGQYYFNPELFARVDVIASARNKLASQKLLGTNGPQLEYLTSGHAIYLDIPIQVGYRFGARHSINFGLSMSPLLGATTYTETRSSSDESLVSKDYQGLAKDGFASFDVAGMVGYQYQLTDQFDLEIGLRFGAFDVTDNSYFGTGIIDDRNHQVRLGVNYRFIKR